MTFRIGIDLGGTKTELVVLNPMGEACYRVRVATPAQDYHRIITAITALVKEAEKRLAITASVGIGTPGSLSPGTPLMRNANTRCLNGKPFCQDLSLALEREVRMANDANCFALSEAVDGAGQGHQVVFGVILGTGTGGGVVVNRQCLNGVNGVAGEWGHNPLPWPTPAESPGPECFCGKRGCIETFVSGTGLARDFAATGAAPLRPQQIAERAAAGDTRAIVTLERYHDRLARALASVVNLLDP
ncbi:MAG: ROK family protein, partial [Halomonadaceae bacterium]